MNRPRQYRHINFVTNILIVALVAAIIGVLLYRIKTSNSQEAQLLRAGESFNGVQEINFSKSSITVLLALDTKCSYCDLSLPVYKKIIVKARQNSGTRVLALFDSSKDEVESYLRERELDLEFIDSTELVRSRIDMAPTIVIVDTNRVIIASYEGMLKDDQDVVFFETLEREILAHQ